MSIRFYLRLFIVLASGLTFAAVQHTPGEFNVNSLGNANYSVPILVPPGTAGMTPMLALHYNSASNNGLVGIGWSLGGLAAITRCTATFATDGYQGGVKLAATDRFCFNGQRLLAISGAYGANGTEYRTEIETFTKVISYGSAGSGPAYFKAWLKSGQIMEFGNSADSRIEAQGQSTVRVWAVNKVEDKKGNYYTISYTEDNPNGQYYPARIDYTGNTAAGLAPYNSVRFVYAARPDNNHTSYVGPSLVRQTVRLTNVQTYQGAALVKDYRLAYQTAPVTQVSRLQSLTECGGDGVCLQPSTFTYQDGGGGLVAGAPAQNVFLRTAAIDLSRDDIQILTADFDGDGINDFFFYDRLHEWYCRGGAIADTSNCRGSSFGLYTTGFVVGDFDGDGMTDLILAGPGGTLYCPAPFEDRLCQRVRDEWRWEGYESYVADFNGDGKADILRRNTQNAFACLSEPGVLAEANCNNVAAGGIWSGYTIQLADINGDGLTDILLIGAINRFCASPAAVTQYDACTRIAGLPEWTEVYTPLKGDFNGDGKQDLFWAGINHNLFCPGPGIGIENNCVRITTGVDWKNQFTIYPGDYNNDGKTDLLLIDHSGGTKFCAGPGVTMTDNCVATGAQGTTRVFIGEFNGDRGNRCILCALLLQRRTQRMFSSFSGLSTTPGSFDPDQQWFTSEHNR